MFPTQNRAVTKLDYEALAYNMDAKFGLIKRCAIYQDPNWVWCQDQALASF